MIDQWHREWRWNPSSDVRVCGVALLRDAYLNHRRYKFTVGLWIAQLIVEWHVKLPSMWDDFDPEYPYDLPY